VIFSLAKAKVPALSGAKGGGSLTPDKGKSTPRNPTVIDRASHSSLESTQIYTHLTAGASAKED